MYRNTKINILNFLLSTVNRLIIVNSLYFFYGSYTLGVFTSIIAFNGAAVMLGSIYELQLSKQKIILTAKNYAYLLLNILTVVLITTIYFGLNPQYIILLISFYIITNCNLLLSGYLFQQKLYFKLRLIHIISEISEISLFLIIMYLWESPSQAIILALILRNVLILVLGSILALRSKAIAKYKISMKSCCPNKTPDYVAHTDVIGNLLIISCFPLTLSALYGVASLGQFSFFRQFFMIGNMLQTAVFRGIWQDYVISKKVRKAIKLFSKVSIAAPVCVTLVGFLFIEDNLKFLFVGCGAMFTFTTFARTKMLINGHINKNIELNHEITFFFFFGIVGFLCGWFGFTDLGVVLIISTLLSLMIHTFMVFRSKNVTKL